jgi:signal transduction histidine kinase
VDITDLIGGVIASLQSESSNKQITLHFQSEPQPTFAFGEPTMLRRLFFNIIHNAVLYTPERGNIRISLSSNRQYTEIRVKDTGIGIPLQDQKKIFDRFYRVDSSRSQTKGYGLGLAICKSIIELHKGRIVVHSALGQGSTFILMLPRVIS